MSIPAPTTPNPATVPPKLRIKELRLQNYRAFRNARLVFDDVTFLVGRNGAGKSTLMDAMSFLGESLRDSLPTAIERRGNYSGIAHRSGGTQANGVSMSLICENTDDKGLARFVLYGIRIVPSTDGSSYEVAQEWFSFSKNPRTGRRELQVGDHRNLENKTKMHYPLLISFFTRENPLIFGLREAVDMSSVVQLSSQLLAAEPGIGSEDRLDRYGANVGDVLKRASDEDRHWIEQRLGVIVPGIQGVRATARAGRRVIEFLQDAGDGETATFDASMMSNGTLRSLGILLALRQNPRPSIVMVDEIEDSLHPFAQSVLLEAIEEMSVEFPVVVSTHNPEVLSHPSARPERVRIIQWNDGASEIRHLSKKVVEELQPPDTVGDLLRSNALWTEDEPSTCPEGDAFFEV